MSKEEFNAYLGAGTSYQGQLSFLGTVRIDGEYTGEIKSEGTLILGKDARVRGKIQVAQLILSGTIEGEVLVSKKMTMHKTAYLLGNIVTPVLAMEEGSTLQGRVQMTQDPMPRDATMLTAGQAEVIEAEEIR